MVSFVLEVHEYLRKRVKYVIKFSYLYYIITYFIINIK